MELPEEFLNSMEQQIKLCSKPYDLKNEHMKFSAGNDRYSRSLVGEVAAYIYVMHLWKTLPRETNIRVTHTYTEQFTNKIDVYVNDVPEQIKSGNEGLYHDIYNHNDWFAGIAENLVAVCWQKRSIHKHTRIKWKTLSKDYADWIDRKAFVQDGGLIEPIHPDIVAIVEKVLYDKNN